MNYRSNLWIKPRRQRALPSSPMSRPCSTCSTGIFCLIGAHPSEHRKYFRQWWWQTEVVQKQDWQYRKLSFHNLVHIWGSILQEVTFCSHFLFRSLHAKELFCWEHIVWGKRDRQWLRCQTDKPQNSYQERLDCEGSQENWWNSVFPERTNQSNSLVNHQSRLMEN